MLPYDHSNNILNIAQAEGIEPSDIFTSIQNPLDLLATDIENLMLYLDPIQQYHTRDPDTDSDAIAEATDEHRDHHPHSRDFNSDQRTGSRSSSSSHYSHSPHSPHSS